MAEERSETDTSGGSLGLQDAADRLGVHYQTAYGWVRDGSLPATKVRGRYQVRIADLDRFAAERARPEPPRPRAMRDPDRTAAKAFEQVVAGDEFALRRDMQRLADEGVAVSTLLRDVLAPAAVRVGDGWHRGEIPVAVEHRATSIIERIIGDLMPNPRGRRRGTAVVAAISGEQHSLPLLMATATLREDRWHVEHLGADCPPEDIADFGAACAADLVVLSTTNDATAGATDRLAAELRTRGFRVLVGRPGGALDDLRRDARDGERGRA